MNRGAECKRKGRISIERGAIMEKNVGKVDSYIRFLLGISFLLNIFALHTGVIGTIILLVLGVAMIASSVMGYCWVYALLKIDTCTAAAPEEPQAPAAHH